MVKFILIKSPDEWATTKQACRDELVVYVFFFFRIHFALLPYIYIYIWDILHNNIPQHQTRKIIEALEIRKKDTETVMNGCIGRVLTIH